MLNEKSSHKSEMSVTLDLYRKAETFLSIRMARLSQKHFYVSQIQITRIKGIHYQMTETGSFRRERCLSGQIHG